MCHAEKNDTGGINMQRISWIGVGIMGKAMVRNLMKAGYEVHIYARHPEKVADVISEGAVPHGSMSMSVMPLAALSRILPGAK